ncbi:hypothetical protein BDW42DRAFT_166856 [Aspergillus taichungensis]|uniref:Uncharacterized protein n=1 Tax=Aspergillus taichungensis TaxID=482145 RepID=A0A2J5HYB7_9EURO|nr:hypothetical protein BDW42DRAFT_166856 [Aspergillus taichungensis]
MNELKGAESGKLDPTLAPYRSFLLGLYNNYKDSLIDKLFYETLAYRYRTLQDFSKILQSGHTIAELSVMQGQILQDVIDYENRVTSIEQPFKNLITHPMKCASTDSIAAFRKGGVLFFHIPTNEAAFQGLAQLQLTKFTVSIPGVRFQSDSKTVFVRLKCHGDCSVVDPKSSSTIFHFTHNPIEAAYKYEIIEHGNGHSEEHYLAGGALVNTEDGPGQKSISLSPFCTWSMSLPSEYNTGVDLSQVSDVILGFGGKGVPISAEYRAVWAAKWQA